MDRDGCQAKMASIQSTVTLQCFSVVTSFSPKKKGKTAMKEKKEPSRASVIAGNIFIIVLILGWLAFQNWVNKEGLTGRPSTIWRPDY